MPLASLPELAARPLPFDTMDAHNSGSPTTAQQGRHSSLLLRRLMAALTAALAVFAIGGIVLAHSGLGAASPSAGSIVGGEITELQLRFNSTVADVEGSVTDPNGDIVESAWVQDGNLRVVVTLAEPLAVPGEYAVRHTTTDVQDNDRIQAAYLFTFDPTAAPPQLEIISDDAGFPWIWVVLGVGVIVIGALGWQLSRSLKRARLHSTTT